MAFNRALIFTRMMSSIIRQNFSPKCEELINKQINLELYSSHTYLSLAFYFHRHDVALPGLHNFFKNSSQEEREHSMKFMTYLNKRGGKLIFEDVTKPIKNEWGSAQEALKSALDLEIRVNENLLKLHCLAQQENDPHLCDFLETEFLEVQVQDIKRLGDMITNVERCGEGLGAFVFDKEVEHLINNK